MATKKNNDKQIEEIVEICDDLEAKLKSMREDKKKKCNAAKEQLVENLKVTADKYRTATGVMEALRTYRLVMDDCVRDVGISTQISTARNLARNMSNQVEHMAEKAEKLDSNEMDKLCEEFYNPDFVLLDDISGFTLAFELMCLDLCRNVGPAAEDMVEFIKRTDEEVLATEEELAKQEAKLKEL